jgi:hypothetical protein
MSRPVRDLNELLRTLHAVRHEGVYVFCLLPPQYDIGTLPAVGTFREEEGWTAVLEERTAAALGLAAIFRAEWITLTVHSDFEAVGMTAAVASALTEVGISCNVVAAVHHDHVFVPVGQGEGALAALARLQSSRET